jgi:hypothetical protein
MCGLMADFTNGGYVELCLYGKIVDLTLKALKNPGWYDRFGVYSSGGTQWQ